MALRGGNSKQTVKTALTGGGRARTAATAKEAEARQEQIGVHYTNQKHECTTGANGCDNPCPLAHPTP